jgi:hypothetical protein
MYDSVIARYDSVIAMYDSVIATALSGDTVEIARTLRHYFWKSKAVPPDNKS